MVIGGDVKRYLANVLLNVKCSLDERAFQNVFLIKFHR